MSNMKTAFQFVKREWVFLAILLFVFLCATYRLTEVPPTWYDEGMIVQLAMNLLWHGTMATQIAPGVFASGGYTSTGFPVVMPVALSFKLFGVSLLAARSVMVLYLLLFICASYYFITRIAGRTAGLFSIGLLATFSTLYGDGKNVLGEVPGLFYLLLFLIFAHKLFDEGYATKKNALLAGLFAGLCLATKPTFLVLGGAVVIALLYTYFYERKKVPFSLVVYASLAALVPMLVWALTQFGVRAPLSLVLAFYANPYGLQHIPSVMLHNALRFFHESTPLYLLGMIGVWAVAVLMRLWRRVSISFAEATAFLFVFFIILAYLRTPGWYRYFFPAQLIAPLFFPMSLGYIARQFSVAKMAVLLQRMAIVLLVLIIVLQLYLLLFGSWISQYYHADKTQVLEHYFKNWDPNTSIFVYDMPEIPLFLPPGVRYYQYLSLGGQDFGDLGVKELSLIAQKVPDVLLVSAGSSTASFAGYHEQDTVEGIAVLKRDR